MNLSLKDYIKRSLFLNSLLPLAPINIEDRVEYIQYRAPKDEVIRVATKRYNEI